MRFPGTELVADLGQRGTKDIGRCQVLWPLVAEHSRRGGPRMPVGGEGGSHPEGVHSDPTAAAIDVEYDTGTESEWSVAHRAPDDRPAKVIQRPDGPRSVLAPRDPQPEVLDRKAMHLYLHALKVLQLARYAMEKQVEAQAAAISDGRDPTDGRTMAEIVAIRAHGRAIVGDRECMICHEPTAKLIAGMDRACYDAWYDAGKPDKGDWAHRRRSFLADKRQRAEVDHKLLTETEWDPSLNFSAGPADGQDRRAA
jgi:hypothetical protein